MDLVEANPFSRIVTSKYKNLAGVREEVEKYVDEKWGLDEKPSEKPQKRAPNSLPRVALLGPKKKSKTHTEKLREKNEK